MCMHSEGVKGVQRLLRWERIKFQWILSADFLHEEHQLRSKQGASGNKRERKASASSSRHH